MLEKVEKFIIKNRLITDGDCVLVGLSGGPDSVALLQCLNMLKSNLGCCLIACHFHHQIRGKEADKDAKFACDFANELGIQFFSGDANVPAIKRKDGGTIEEVARAERYKFFCRIAKKCGANKIALGHNADDSVETFLFNLLRGTGIRGLAGIAVKRKEGEFEIIRPFLSTTKKEILEYLGKHKIPYRTDSTNLKNIYSRNKIRLNLLPYLRKEYNPKIAKTLFNTSRYICECVDYIQTEIMNLSFKFANNIKNGFSIPLKQLKNLHPAIRNLFLRQLFEDKFGSSLNDEMLDNINSLTIKKGCYRTIIHQDITVSLEYGNLRFLKGCNRQRINQTVNIKIPSKNILSEWNIELETSVLKAGIVLKKTYLSKKSSLGKIWQSATTNSEVIRITEYLDADKVSANTIIIRAREPGDRYQPLGQNGNRSLKKLFIDEKVPISIKKRIPVLIAGGKIIYVVGHRIADSVKITDSTKRVLKLSLTIFPL